MGSVKDSSWIDNRLSPPLDELEFLAELAEKSKLPEKRKAAKYWRQRVEQAKKRREDKFK